MGEWLWCLLGWLCAACAAVKLIGFCWFLVELRRKWRSIPELWSIDWLDIVCRLELEFEVTLTAADLADRSADERMALSAGQLWELVAAKMRVAGREVPADDRIHELEFEAPIDRSGGVALRHFPQLHTNPVEVIAWGGAAKTTPAMAIA